MRDAKGQRLGGPLLGPFSWGWGFEVANPPQAKFSLCVTNNFTAYSDAGEYCGFRHVRWCTRQKEWAKMCLLCDWNALEIRGTIQRSPGNSSKLQDSWRWRNFPLLKLSPLRQLCHLRWVW